MSPGRARFITLWVGEWGIRAHFLGRCLQLYEQFGSACVLPSMVLRTPTLDFSRTGVRGGQGKRMSGRGKFRPRPRSPLPALFREPTPTTTMTFLLSELVAVRVLCKAPPCSEVTEVPVHELSHALPDGRCPACGQPALDLSDGHPLALLARALKAVSAPQTHGDVELVLARANSGGPISDASCQPTAVLGK